MIRRIHLRYLLLFVVLVLLQVLVMNQVLLGGYMNPQLYVLFILMLPVNTPGWFLLTVSFSAGLVVDVFSDSLAMHAAASTLMAFCRPAIIRLTVESIRWDEIVFPSFSSFGNIPLIAYSAILIFFHHTVLFFLEIFRLDEFLRTMLRIALSSSLTLVFVIIGFALLEKSFTR